MTRGELLRKLFRSYASQDSYAFRAAALEIIAEEQQKQNHALARDLLNILEEPRSISKTGDLSRKSSLPADRDNQLNLIELRNPVHDLSDVVLSDKNRDQILRILTEYKRSEMLKMHGLKPKMRILLAGPSGTGKTLCAEIIAKELHLPLLYARFDSIISSYLGETSSNLRKIFEYAKTGRFVILLDEFDTVGKSRINSNDHGELNRAVNNFLQIMDDFHGDSIIIAATNNPDVLDMALWRRFDEVVQFEKPSGFEIRVLLEMKLKNFPLYNVNLNEFAKELSGLSQAEIEWICLDAIKSAIIHDLGEVTQSILDESLTRQRNRGAVTSSKKVKRVNHA